MRGGAQRGARALCELHGAAVRYALDSAYPWRVYASITAVCRYRYRLLRDSDKAGLDIGVHRSSGLARKEDHDVFCKGTACFLLRIYDQSPQGKHSAKA